MKTLIQHIDINADLGEGSGNDAALMPYISSCNIACGGHAGDEISMQQTIALAQKYSVKIGAHPSFPDADNFGRKVLTMTKSELSESIFYQLLQFYAICETQEAPLHHIKLHGALYNYAAKDASTADAVVEAVIATKSRPVLYVPHNSVLHKKAENLLPLSFEAFIDRRYQEDGSLIERAHKNAVITSKEEAWEQLYRMVTTKSVSVPSGKTIPLYASTYCIHGDHKDSVAILQYLQQQMKAHHLALAT
jgi:UPF0271 protein